MIDIRLSPVARVLLPLFGGSLLGYLGSPGIALVFVLFTCLMLWIVLLYVFRLFREKTVFQAALFGFMVFCLFFCAGLGMGMMDKPEDPGLPVGERILISGNIQEGPVQRNERFEYEFELRLVQTGDTAYKAVTLLKVYMQLPGDSLLPVPGETWRLGGRLVAIHNSGNPGEVDYAAILKRKDCWYRFYCDTIPELNYQIEGSKAGNLNAVRIRNALAEQWKGPPQALALLKAVCLGDRSGLSETLRHSYSMAGGMHVLAVSGLHVGLIWWVLHRFFSFLVRLFRREIYRAVLIILLLWFYAYVTGFSSSVCRSVTMFSFVSAARLMHHRSHPVNALLVSMFLLVVIHPGRLLEVGFQLSYAAVLAIVTLHPVLKRLVRVKRRVLRWAWEVTGISLAAQIGTLPLVIYYFHQIPVYALITNLVAIPLLSCIIALFVLSVPLTVMGTGAGVINRLLVFLGDLMNSTMTAIASIPGSVIDRLFLDPVCTLLIIVLVFLGIALLKGKARLLKYMCIFTLSMILVQSARIHFSRLQASQVIVGHFYKGSIITVREGLFVDHYIWSNDQASVAYMDRYLESAWGQRSYEVSVARVNGGKRNYRSKEENTYPFQGGISTCYPLCQGTWLVGNQKYRGLVIAAALDQEHLGVLLGVDTAFLLLSGEPDMSPAHMDELFLQSHDVILDGTNRDWYCKQWAQCKGEPDHWKGHIHITGEQGAYHHWK